MQNILSYYAWLSHTMKQTFGVSGDVSSYESSQKTRGRGNMYEDI